MKQKLAIIASVLLLSFASNAMGQWTFMAEPFHDDTYPPPYGGAESFAGDEKFFFSGGNTGLVRSIDTGKTWIFLDSADFHRDEITTLFSDGTNLYVGAQGLYRSSDNGNTWFQIDYGKIWRVYSITEFNSVLLTYCEYPISGSVTRIMRSTDNGNSWTSIDSFNSALCFEAMGKSLFAGTYKGVFRSDDSGKNWFQSDTNFRSRVNCLLEHQGSIFAGGDNGIYRSNDSGTSWQMVYTSYAGITSIAQHDNTLFAADYYGYTSQIGVLRSSDNGTTWYNVNAGLTTGVHSLYNVGEYLFAGTNSGIYRRSFTDLADVSERKGISNLNLFLSPNPTTGIITIHNAPPNMLHVTITNVLGETASEVTNLGAPDFTIDLSKLHPGTYFARFTGEGEVLTRKILKE